MLRWLFWQVSIMLLPKTALFSFFTTQGKRKSGGLFLPVFLLFQCGCWYLPFFIYPFKDLFSERFCSLLHVAFEAFSEAIYDFFHLSFFDRLRFKSHPIKVKSNFPFLKSGEKFGNDFIIRCFFVLHRPYVAHILVDDWVEAFTEGLNRCLLFYAENFLCELYLI
jgi:hypothetical protein